ncbi:MAG: redoxin domain-containing protein [Gemmatales bacterium]
MMRVFLLLAAIALPTAALYPYSSESSVEDKIVPPAPVGTRITDIVSSDATTGKPWSLADHAREAKAVVVLFMGTECPVNNAYSPRLADLNKKYGDKGVVFVGINSNEQDDVEAIAKHAKAYQIPFPVLKDENFKLAEKFSVVRIPEVFVLDGQRFVRYRGRIDDQFTPIAKREKATSRDLLDALDAVLNGQEVKTAATTPAGCLLGRTKTPVEPKAGEAITYTKHIAPIIQSHCQACHRPGEVGPFKLMGYKDAAAWADNIKEVVLDGRMPPWHADPKVGHFSNDRRLTNAEKTTLLAWIDQGCTKGDPKDEPAPKDYVSGWSIGKPDMILKMTKTIKIPANAGPLGMPYQYVPVGEVFKEDTWVQAGEARPDNHALVHHIIAYVIPPKEYVEPDVTTFTPEKIREMQKEMQKAQAAGNNKTGSAAGSGGLRAGKPPGGLTNLARAFLPNGQAELQKRPPTLDGVGQGLLIAYAPGDQPMILAPGQAKLIPKGSQIILQMHYTPNGKAGTDCSSVGLVFAKEPPKNQVRSRSVMNPRFEIPPGDANYEVKAVRAFEKDAVIVSFLPHMHYRGKSFLYEIVYPDGKREPILNVPKYDFNWQTTYELAKPIRVPAGTKIECTAFFDNSKNNPFNPNPKGTVYWGEQTWEEMMIGFLDYYFVKE